MPEDEDLDRLAQGDDDTDEDLQALDAEPAEPDEDVDPEPVAPAPPDPAALMAEENRQLRAALASAAQYQQPQAQPQPVQPHQLYERPDDRDDVRPWRKLIGETVEPRIQAEITNLRQQAARDNAVRTFTASESNARATLPDFERYAPAIAAMIQQWIPALAIVPPNIHELAYNQLKMVEQRQRQAQKVTGSAKRRVAEGGGATNAAPQKPRRQPDGPMTPERVARMTGKEAYDYLAKRNVRVL